MWYKERLRNMWKWTWRILLSAFILLYLIFGVKLTSMLYRFNTNPYLPVAIFRLEYAQFLPAYDIGIEASPNIIEKGLAMDALQPWGDHVIVRTPAGRFCIGRVDYYKHPWDGKIIGINYSSLMPYSKFKMYIYELDDSFDLSNYQEGAVLPVKDILNVWDY